MFNAAEHTLAGKLQEREAAADVPIFEYRTIEGDACPVCTAGFERLQKSGDTPLFKCPECGNAVQRVMSAPSLCKPSPDLDPKSLESHGFTQYRKSGKGTYEKTAGKGPRIIEKDQ